MAANLRFEGCSSSPDAATFMGGVPNGLRNMDRSSSSFRDGSGQQQAAEPVQLTQLLSLELIPLGEQKYAKQLELRRVTTAVTEDPAQVRPLDGLGADELKKVKHSISENSSRARERSRYMGEAIVKLDKYRSSLSKKRSKPELASDRGPGASPLDRPLTLKTASQPEGLKPAEKSKGLAPNKRFRSSITAEAAARPSNIPLKKSGDRESPRSSSVLPSPTEDKVRTPTEGWEKNKLKGRRSAIKTDPNIPPAGNGLLEGERDHKWSGGQHRLSQEARTRLNETHGLRSGPVHGVTSIHKTETTLQINGSASGEKPDRFLGMDKERLPKNGLKPPLQDDMHVMAGSSTVTKGKASRAPRSSSMATHLSHLNRASSALVDKPPQSSSKAQLPTGQGNRKRPAPSRSSSPVAQWGGQRPQKIARAARRPAGTSLVPSSDDVGAVHDGGIPDRDLSPTVGVRFTTGSNGVPGAPRRLPAGGLHLPAQSKARSERVTSSVVVSESEESEEASENKAKDRGKKQGEWEARPVTNHKTSLVIPTKASQSTLKEEAGDGVRRQGRSGRNFCLPKPVDKLDVATSTAKQLRSARTDKTDRTGRTPSQATIDRRLRRLKRPSAGVNAAVTAADISGLVISPGESDEDHEELVSAVRAAVDASAAACSSDFWKEMEPYFTFRTADHLSYLRQLVESKSSSDVSSGPSSDNFQKNFGCANGNLEHDDRSEVRTGGRGGGGGGWFDKIYPLSQRLLAALINEEEESHEGDGLRDGYPTASTGLQDQKYISDGSLYPNGHGGGHSPYFEVAGDADDILTDGRAAESVRGYDTVEHPGAKTDGYCTNRSGNTCELTSFNDKILLELQSIGLVVEQVPDLSQRDEDEIGVEISKLKDELKDQVCVNRQRILTLEKSVLAKREEESRERERLALSKLVEIAYSRRKGCRGNSGLAKGAGNKGSRAALLAFSKRALVRMRRFEAGHSCIVDPGLRDILLCNLTKATKASAGANSADTCVTPGVSETSVVPKSAGKLILRRTDAKVEGNGELVKGKDAPWPSWKDRDVSSEDPAGATSVRNAVGFGGAKGKRSERERDGKGQGKESQKKNEADRVPRQGLGTVKGERKTKTKPRAKAFKDVNGLGKPAEAPKESLAASASASASAVAVAAAPLQLEDPGSMTVMTEGGLDLTAIPEDLGVHDEAQDIGAWLSLEEDTTLQDQGELLMGLDVPMDDLRDLGMMM